MQLVEHTIGEYISEIAQKQPHALAVVFGAERITYEQLDAHTDAIAKGLLATGVRKGTHVGLAVQNRPASLFCLLAALKIGAVAVLTCGTVSQMEWELRQEESDVSVVLDTDSLHALVQAGKRITQAELIAARHEVSPENTDVILFTSGTTGRPKLVPTTHRARLNNAIATARAIGVTAQDRFCIALPMHHCFCLTAGVLCALVSGACICFTMDHHSMHILNTIQQHRCTVLHGVPTMFFAVCARQAREPRNIESLRVGLIGGAGYTPKQFLEIRQQLHFELLPSLGQTEATAGITIASSRDKLHVKSQTVGKLFPGLTARFCDAQTGEVLTNGEKGELCIRGYSVFQGYYGQDGQSPIDAEGYLHTGDLGCMDEEGNITIYGRLKDIIIRGGENIAPAEVEAALRACSGVQAAKVMGVRDDHFGEEICACIVADLPGKTSAKALRIELLQRLAAYKIPKYMLFLRGLPINESGKVHQALLKQFIIEAIQKGETV